MGMDTVDLVLEAERHFGVSVPDERAEKTETVEEFARLLCELRAQTPAPLEYQEVLLQLQELVSRMFDIPLGQITPEARFVKDLGLG